MNKILIDQLNKLKVAKVEFSDSDTEIIIPKTIKISNSSISLGNVYKVKLFDSIKSSSSTLAANWNNGIIPKNDEYIVEIVEKLGNMIRVNGVATNDDYDQFQGWLPIDGFEIISKE